MLILVLGIAVLVAVIAGVTAAIVMANRAQKADAPPSSLPSDFVAPISSGGYRFRSVDESPEDFRARIARENSAQGSAKR